MGKGIPDIVTGQFSGGDGSCTTDGRHSPSTTEAAPRADEFPNADIRSERSEHDRAHDTLSEEEGGRKAEAGVDRRIHLLDRARRRMADAGVKASAACSEARAATKSGAACRVDLDG